MKKLIMFVGVLVVMVPGCFLVIGLSSSRSNKQGRTQQMPSVAPIGVSGVAKITTIPYEILEDFKGNDGSYIKTVLVEPRQSKRDLTNLVSHLRDNLWGNKVTISIFDDKDAWKSLKSDNRNNRELIKHWMAVFTVKTNGEMEVRWMQDSK